MVMRSKGRRIQDWHGNEWIDGMQREQHGGRCNLVRAGANCISVSHF